MSEIEQRQADRFRVMAAIFKETGANEMATAQLFPIRDALGFTDEYMGAIVSYLAGEGLIKPLRTSTGTFTPMLTRVSHLGIKEMEQSEGQPTAPTEHFPPSNEITINVGGNVIGSALQVGSAGATQHYQAGDIAVGADTKKSIAEFVAEFEAKRTELIEHGEQSTEAVAEISTVVASVQPQLALEKPNKPIIKACLDSAKAILEHGVGGVLTTGLLLMLSQIHL